MKKGLTIILGFAVGMTAVAFTQTILQRPRYAQTGLSYVGYGDATPTNPWGGELFVVVNGAPDGGPVFGIYDDVNLEWDQFGGEVLFSSLTADTVVSYDGAGLVDSLIADDGTDIAFDVGGELNGEVGPAGEIEFHFDTTPQFEFEVYLERSVGVSTRYEVQVPSAAGSGGVGVDLLYRMAALDGNDVIYLYRVEGDNPGGGHAGANNSIIGVFITLDSASTATEAAIGISAQWDYDWQSAGTAFANLGTPANGTFVYCTDCTIANPCAALGNGAFAKRLNGVWVCN